MNTPADYRAAVPAAPAGRIERETKDDLSVPSDAPERLLQELARVAALLRSSTHREPLSAPPAVTAVVRLVSGLDLPRWREISGQCDGWFALPLDQAAARAEPPTTSDGSADAAPATAHDSVTGMARTPLFMERLTMEAERAQHTHRDLTLVLFELDGLDTLDGQAAEHAARVLSSCLWEAANRQDILGRLQGSLLALALPGAGRFQALAVAERVAHEAAQRLTAQGLGWCGPRAGVASMDEDGGPEMRTASLLEHARLALGQTSSAAAATVRERVRLFRTDEDPAERETLVLSSEKQFLFFGGA